MRKIDVDSLLEIMEERRKKLRPDKFARSYEIGIYDGYCGALFDVKRMQCEECEPVRHGRWIYHGMILATCSACGFSCGSYDDDNADRYCSHCGAKMDGGGENAAD